jgi:hypothetical protein
MNVWHKGGLSKRAQVPDAAAQAALTQVRERGLTPHGRGGTTVAAHAASLQCHAAPLHRPELGQGCSL